MSTAVMGTHPVFDDELKIGFWGKAESVGLPQEKLNAVREFLENDRFWKLLKDDITGSSDDQPDILAVQIAQETYDIELTESVSGFDTLRLIMDEYLSTQLPLHECVENGLRKAGLL
jgi:hypothetical protein